ncbi:DctP family TRAP transporter solute-binding subunit [Anaeroselena agilis]|uniref:TRAP transporter substrate-binding protein n=1 Tax=Anaeroselena agilis TaxID=3063788 RepID=A0ABU3P1K7_9FIRM|nr:TRAP transporter substrate-binding protein [Selenomonadales bacterium 4137-cl]
MKKSVALLIILCLATLLAAGCGGGDAKKEQAKPAEKVVLKFGHLADEKNTWHLGALKFKELVEKNSNGRLEVKVYPNEQLGKEKDLVTSIQTGTADIGIFGETLTTFGANKTMMMATPYLLRDAAHLHKVAGGEIGKEIEKQVLDKVKLRVLAYFERGPRDLTSNRPIKSPDDLDGMKLRVPNVPLFVAAWQALGAKPTPMAFSEVFTSLQQGTIDGQENPYALIKSANFFEVQKYLNKTSHVRGWIYVCIGEKKLRSLPADLQKVIVDAGKEMQKYENQLFLKEEAELEKFLKSKMTFVEVDKAAFQAKAKDAVLANLDAEQKELYNKIVTIK